MLNFYLFKEPKEEKSKFSSVKNQFEGNDKTFDVSDYSSVSSSSRDDDIVPENYRSLITDMTSRIVEDEFESSLFSITTIDERHYEIILNEVIEQCERTIQSGTASKELFNKARKFLKLITNHFENKMKVLKFLRDEIIV